MKKEKELPDLEKYYYHRDHNNTPRITICLLKFGELVYKGVSICSKDENIIKEEGNFKARNRALRARKKNESTLCIDRTEALEIISDCDVDTLFFKSEAYPNLTEFENKLMHRKKL